MAYWLVKSDPKSYSWEDMLKEKKTPWDGVRNYQARNNMKDMKKGDKVLFYHSVQGTEVVGVTTVTKEFFQDPTTEDDRWVAVELKAEDTFGDPVPLSKIKETEELQDIPLIKQSRLSVMPLTEKQYNIIVDLSRQ